jgi:hypothetical protein
MTAVKKTNFFLESIFGVNQVKKENFFQIFKANSVLVSVWRDGPFQISVTWQNEQFVHLSKKDII